MNRRRFLTALMAGSVTACQNVPNLLNQCLSGLPQGSEFTALLSEIWQDLDPIQVWDSHVHLVGIGDSSHTSEALPWISPRLSNWLHPQLSLQKQLYINGSCVDENQIDNSYVEHLYQLLSQFPTGYKALILAFDWYHNAQGQSQPEQSIFHIPNSYAEKIAKRYPQRFEWAASIHPYRADSIEVLHQVHAQGARAIKWLPSAMNIDAASAKCDRFYQTLAALKLPIISHSGRENAVPGGDQSLGNPLRFRRALDQGVKIILAHCASDGEDIDLDNRGQKPIKSFALFSRLMDEKNYQTLLYGDISAITIRHHAWVIKPLLQRPDWHSRLLNGSDYPLVGIPPLFSVEDLIEQQLLAAKYQPLFKELQHYHPLLFDFALKRLLRFEGMGFAKSVFETKRILMNQK